MKLQKMVLENFQGIKHCELFLYGKNISVSGDNGVGKTTLFNAFTWLLYGKPSTDEKKFSPQTTGTHHLNHIAEIVIQKDDGGEITLKKDFHEKYETQRGSVESVFSGYRTDHFVNGVPVKESEYKDTLTELYQSEDTAKLLTRFNYFLEDLNIKDRRKLLLDVCGNIGFEEVIAAHPDLSKLPEVLQDKSMGDYVKISASSMKRIDAELKEIPARIDEANKSIPEVSEEKESLQSKLDRLMEKKADAEGQLLAADSTAETEIRKQIADLDLAKSEAARNYAILHENNGKENREKVLNLEVEKKGLETKIRLKKDSISELSAFLKKSENRSSALMDEFSQVMEDEWKGDIVCPTCGQNLPADRIEEAKNKFNVNKSEKLEALNAENKKLSESINEKKKEVENLETEINSLSEELTSIDEELEDARLIEKRETTPIFFVTAECAEFDKKIAALKESLNNITFEVDSKKKQIKDDINAFDSLIREVQSEIAKYGIIRAQESRIKELEDREAELSRKYEVLKNGLYLVDLFNKYKAEMLTDSINKRFKTLKFRLFIQQINGGIADDCEALIDCGNGSFVPFKSANNAARINAGLEVIDILAEHFGFLMPIFIDNAESNNHILETKAQQIRLYVTDDKELLVEAV